MNTSTQTDEQDQRISADEFLESLTGYEEIAIEKAFTRDAMTLAQNSPTTFLRSLVFIVKKREGLNDLDAKNAVLGMTLRQVNDTFSTDEDEVMPEEPDTETGKEDEQPA